MLFPCEQEILCVRFSDGREWKATANQWYYAGYGNYNIAANTESRPAITVDGTATVAKATLTGEKETVHDIEVDGLNVMFVNGVAAEGYSLH